MEIEGKKAVVVGGASGFGRATAEALAKRGAAVAVLDRPQSNGKDVAAEFPRGHPPCIAVEMCDGSGSHTRTRAHM